MSDPFRGGSWGSIGFGPFQTGGGGDSRYLIANDGDAVAQTRKYSAQIAWANGTITDDAYLGELRRYLGTTEKGSRERTSAQNEYDDAVYTIGRNKIVRAVNLATSTNLRVASLRRLVAYDREKLHTMQRDNEQWRELSDRIMDSEDQIRQARYSDLVRRFNANGTGIAEMLAFARNAAAASRGTPAHQAWADKVAEWQNRSADERLNQLYQEYEHAATYDQRSAKGKAILDFLQGRLGDMSEDSPQYKDTQRTIEDLTKRFTEDGRAEKDAQMASRLQNGTVSNEAYLTYLRERMNDYDKGSSDYRTARDNWMQASYSVAEDSMKAKLESGEFTTQDAVSFYRGYMATMDPSSAKFLQLQQQVNDLLVSGTQSLALWPGGEGGIGGYAGIGRWVDLTGAPGGTPVNPKGFASQFDGSAFASSNCGFTSAAMLAWAASGGKVRVSGGDMRYYSGDRDSGGDEKGATFDDLSVAMSAVGMGLEQRHDMGFDAWKRRLLNGEGSIINGSYSVVPSNLRISTFMGPHSMYVDRAVKRDGKVWFMVMDPQARSVAEGTQWWPEEAMRAYGWSGVGNAGGGEWFGDVAFAGKRGRSSTYLDGNRPGTPFQAFDTDADGNSTIGKGGGANRQEAGKRRDWSKGRAAEVQTSWPQWQLPAQKKDGRRDVAKAPEGITDDQVSEFLAAVDSTAGPTLKDPKQWGVARQRGVQGTDEERRARAKALLGEWNGDARLAAVAWFTGSATPDTKSWSQTERFYANAVGTRLGYEAVPRGGTVSQGPAAGMPTVPPTLTPTPAPNPLDMTAAARPVPAQGQALSGTPKDTAYIGKLLLAQLGIPATPDMVRAVVAWISTEGDTVKGNNPFVLRTQGINDLPGQVGKDQASGAVFGTLEEGVRAAADEIRRNFPGLIVAARSGDPERFLVALDRSDWVPGGYRGSTIRTFNEMPGEGNRILVGGLPGYLKAPNDIRSLTLEEPSVAELFDVDPRDPTQMAWLEKNLGAMKEAMEKGWSTWTFTTPGGKPMPLTFAPSMVTDLALAKASYLDWTAKAAEGGDWATHNKAAIAAAAAHDDLQSLRVEQSVDEWQAQYDAYDRVRQSAFGSGDYGTYINATLRMRDLTFTFLGMDPAGPGDPERSRVKGLVSDKTWDQITRALDALEPRNTDDPTSLNRDGDRVMQLWDQGFIIPQRDKDGNVVAAAIPESVAFRVWDENGNIEIHTRLSHEDEFIPVALETFGGQEPQQVPAYTQQYVLLEGPDGAAYTKVNRTGGTMSVSVLTASGAKEAVLPPTDGPGVQRWSPPGGPTNVLGQIQNPIFTTQAGSRQSRLITTAGPEDKQMVTVNNTVIPVWTITKYNPRTKKSETWYSIPNSGQWLGGLADYSQKHAPRLVFGKGITLRNGTILVNGETYDANKHGPIGGLVHWYGTDPSDGANGAMGAPYTRWKLRQGIPLGGGRVAITSVAPDPVTRFLEGDESFEALKATFGDRAPRLGPPTPAGIKPSKPAGAEAVLPFGENRKALAARQIAAVDFDRMLNGETLDQMLARQFGGNLPMNAGAQPVPVARMDTPSTSLVGKLASGIRAFSTVAADAARSAQLAAAQQQAAIAAQKRAAEEQARAAAAQRAANLAKVASSSMDVVKANPMPRFDEPRPKPKSTPMGPQGPATPTPKPAPTPKVPGSTPQEHGNY